MCREITEHLCGSENVLHCCLRFVSRCRFLKHSVFLLPLAPMNKVEQVSAHLWPWVCRAGQLHDLSCIPASRVTTSAFLVSSFFLKVHLCNSNAPEEQGLKSSFKFAQISSTIFFQI